MVVPVAAFPGGTKYWFGRHTVNMTSKLVKTMILLAMLAPAK
jgi:hypothetical protein